MPSKILRAVDSPPQRRLPLTQAQPVPEAVIFAQPTFSAAITLAIQVSGLEEKDVYLELDIDAGHWTRITKGQAHFPVDKLEQFMDVVGNEIPLIWLAHRRGKGLHMLETEAQRLLRLEQEKNEKLEGENRLMRELIKGRE